MSVLMWRCVMNRFAVVTLLAALYLAHSNPDLDRFPSLKEAEWKETTLRDYHAWMRKYIKERIEKEGYTDKTRALPSRADGAYIRWQAWKALVEAHKEQAKLPKGDVNRHLVVLKKWLHADQCAKG